MTSACGCLRWLGLAVYLLYSLQYPSTSCGESISCLELKECVASTQWNLNFNVRDQASHTLLPLLPQSLSLKSVLKYFIIEVVYHVNGVWKRDILDVTRCCWGHLKKKEISQVVNLKSWQQYVGAWNSFFSRLNNQMEFD